MTLLSRYIAKRAPESYCWFGPLFGASRTAPSFMPLLVQWMQVLMAALVPTVFNIRPSEGCFYVGIHMRMRALVYTRLLVSSNRY